MKTFYSIIKNTNNQQKKSITLSFISTCFFTSLINAQISAGAPGNFGIDGDLKNDYNMSGSFTAAGTHDWFKLIAGTGIGVIDTTNTNSYKVSLAAGNNISFDKGMSVARYSTVDGKLLLDARYGRDQFGNGTAAATMDYTSFIAAKNGDNPATWPTVPTGAAVGDKYDIVDAFMHMRRDGTVITAPSPSHLIANVGISTVGNTGTRYFDAELYCTKIAYNTSTGVFSNSGPAATGGHTAWTFNADGTINHFGDMTISFSFTSATCNEIYIMVWVSQTTFLTVNPAGFDFVAGEYYGAIGGYGYGKIKPNSGTATLWGIANSAVSTTPLWGTNSKTLGNMSLNNYSTSYDVGQFGEAAIDLTELGVDPALMSGNNPCTPPFSRIVFKSRSSSSFTSALQDFAGPYEFLDAPVPSSAVKPPVILTCNVSTQTLEPASYQPGAYYEWSTTGGNIVSRADTPFIVINKPGKYYLSSSIFQGCSLTTDSMIVNQDIHKPVATALNNDWLNPLWGKNSVTLHGGDTTASYYSNSYGSYTGLLWDWSGPGSFTSAIQNPKAGIIGTYQLIVTNISNGCTDTATTELEYATLPVKLVSFTAMLNTNKVDLNWITATEMNVNHFVIERSTDGQTFSDAGMVFAFGNTTEQKNYQYSDNITSMNSAVIYYRLRQMDIDGKFEYSATRIIRISKQNENPITILTYPNPVTSELRITIPNNWQGKKVMYEIVNANGHVSGKSQVGNSSQTETLNVGILSPGLYIVKASCEGQSAQQKIVKQ